MKAGESFFENPMDTPFIPTWSRVKSAIPDFIERLKETVEIDNKNYNNWCSLKIEKHEKSILSSIEKIPYHFVFPAHPRTRQMLENDLELPSNIQLIDALGYLEMMGLVESSQFVLTDSGGLQKEAFFLKKKSI